MFSPSSPMDISFYQQLQLSPPPSPKQGHHPAPAALCYYPAAAAYPSPPPPPPPPFATDDGFPSPPPQPPPKVDGVERVVVARKDRHSKICTAGGMRDRRMRLSLDVARRFFALQDKLGFDKASKTVQWLLDMSRAGIKELMMSEDGSGLSDTTKKHDEQQIIMDSDRKKKRPIKALIKRAAARKATRKLSNASSSSISTIDKESRARARERARERTKERNRLRWATLASSISIDEAPPPPPSSRHLDMASQLEDAIPSFEHSSYYHQDQWELSGVVFAKANALFH